MMSYLSRMLKNIALWALLLGFSRITFCQEIIDEIEPYHKHRLTIMMANSHIPAANNINDQDAVFIVPTWGFDYDYWLSPKWAVGPHNDLVLQQYKIETKGGEEVIERSFPVSVSAVGIFRPWEHWAFVSGMGREFEKNESFNLYMLGVEYGIELPHDWELSFNLVYENKLATYNSWLFGIGISKLLGPNYAE